MPTPRQRTLLYIAALGIIAFLIWAQQGKPRRTPNPLASAPAQVKKPAKSKEVPAPRPRGRASVRPQALTERPFAHDDAPAPEEAARFEPTPTQGQKARITVRVVEADGSPVDGAPVTSADCDLYTIARGGKAVLTLDPGQVCEVRGGRRDGMLVAWSDPEVVQGSRGPTEVTLTVPEEETAGLGISIGEHEYGVLVRNVFPDSPAWEAGLRPGDVIVELDRRDTTRMTLDEFIADATGPVDTQVEIVVARGALEGDDWEEFTARVVRKPVSRPRG